jgi:hypothetical protein
VSRLAAAEQARIPALLVALTGFAAATVVASQVYRFPVPVLLLLVALLGLTFLPATLVLRSPSAGRRMTTARAVVVTAVAAAAGVGVVYVARGQQWQETALAFGALVVPSVLFAVLLRRRSHTEARDRTRGSL